MRLPLEARLVFFFLLVEWTFSFTAKLRMICHSDSQSISLFCSYNYNALMMHKQMIMEQYRNNKTLNSCFFSVSTKVQIKLDASPQAQHTDEVTNYVFSKCLNNYILFYVTHQICHVLALPTVHIL